MSIKKFARIACVTAVAGITVCTAAFSGCTIETNHPRAEVTIEFNDNTYVLDYKLYRNMYPQTVKRFIELADAGFYDNTIIHNYTASDWYGGNYAYVSESGEAMGYADAYSLTGGMADYLSENSKEQYFYEQIFKNGLLTPSVYKTYDANYNGEEPLSTLIGEFEANDHTIEKGALTSQYGALRMYYTAGKTYNGSSASEKVWVENTVDDEAFERDYTYNSATSLFAIQVGSASSLSADCYCIFAVLRNDSAVEALEELEDAISEYIETNLSDDATKFIQSVEATVDNYEEIADKGTEVTYSCTAKPLIIKSVKITKY